MKFFNYSYIYIRKISAVFLLIGSVTLIDACNKHDLISPQSSSKNYKNLFYGNDPQQIMDVYLPAGRNPDSTPLLVLIHGGAWVSGDKSDFVPYIDSIKKYLPQYAIANINYRLATVTGNYFPVQEDDVDSAMQFLLRNITAYDISGHFIYLGVSAGGQLALLQAYKYSSPKASAVVSFFGPSDMMDLYLHSPDTALIKYLPILMGGTPNQNPQMYFRSSPINYVSSTSCPTLLLQGGEDPLVPPTEAFHLQDTLQKLGVINQLVFYPNDGHGWTGPDLEDSFEKIQEFLNKNVK